MKTSTIIVRTVFETFSLLKYIIHASNMQFNTNVSDMDPGWAEATQDEAQSSQGTSSDAVVKQPGV